MSSAVADRAASMGRTDHPGIRRGKNASASEKVTGECDHQPARMDQTDIGAGRPSTAPAALEPDQALGVSGKGQRLRKRRTPATMRKKMIDAHPTAEAAKGHTASLQQRDRAAILYFLSDVPPREEMFQQREEGGGTAPGGGIAASTGAAADGLQHTRSSPVAGSPDEHEAADTANNDCNKCHLCTATRLHHVIPGKGRSAPGRLLHPCSAQPPSNWEVRGRLGHRGEDPWSDPSRSLGRSARPRAARAPGCCVFVVSAKSVRWTGGRAGGAALVSAGVARWVVRGKTG